MFRVKLFGVFILILAKKLRSCEEFFSNLCVVGRDCSSCLGMFWFAGFGHNFDVFISMGPKVFLNFVCGLDK